MQFNNIEDRNTEVMKHVGWVKRIARDLRVPKSAKLVDLAQDGMVQVIHALNNFDPGRGVKFRTYAEAGVRGAMMDRSARPFGRHTRKGEPVKVKSGYKKKVLERPDLRPISRNETDHSMEAARDKRWLLGKMPSHCAVIIDAYCRDKADGGLTQKEIGDQIGVSETRIYRVVEKCLANCRDLIDGNPVKWPFFRKWGGSLRLPQYGHAFVASITPSCDPSWEPKEKPEGLQEVTTQRRSGTGVHRSLGSTRRTAFRRAA